MTRPQVRLDDRGLVEHRLGRALRDLLPVVEGDDAMGEAAQEADLVVYETERGAGRVHLGEHRLQVADLVAPEAGGRLIEEEELGLAHESHGDAEHFLLAIGEIARELLDRSDRKSTRLNSSHL